MNKIAILLLSILLVCAAAETEERHYLRGRALTNCIKTCMNDKGWTKGKCQERKCDKEKENSNTNNTKTSVAQKRQKQRDDKRAKTNPQRKWCEEKAERLRKKKQAEARNNIFADPNNGGNKEFENNRAADKKYLRGWQYKALENEGHSGGSHDGEDEKSHGGGCGGGGGGHDVDGSEEKTHKGGSGSGSGGGGSGGSHD
eukprot:938864_1